MDDDPEKRVWEGLAILMDANRALTELSDYLDLQVSMVQQFDYSWTATAYEWERPDHPITATEQTCADGPREAVGSLGKAFGLAYANHRWKPT